MVLYKRNLKSSYEIKFGKLEDQAAKSLPGDFSYDSQAITFNPRLVIRGRTLYIPYQTIRSLRTGLQQTNIYRTYLYGTMRESSPHKSYISGYLAEIACNVDHAPAFVTLKFPRHGAIDAENEFKKFSAMLSSRGVGLGNSSAPESDYSSPRPAATPMPPRCRRCGRMLTELSPTSWGCSECGVTMERTGRAWELQASTHM